MTPDEMAIRLWLHGKPPATAEAYRRDALSYFATGRTLASTTLADLQAWDAELAAAGRKSTYRARRIAALRSLFAFAAAEKLIPDNPAIRMQVRREPEGEIERIASEADVVRMIAAEPVPRRRAALRLLYLCGLRASELRGLRWSSMLPARKGGGEARIIGKGDKPRVVLIPADLWAELAALTPAATPASPVVPGRDGKALDRKTLQRIVKRAAIRAGLDPRFSPHWLRHSSATHALNAGCPVQVVQHRLGHASLATTTRYAHTAADQGMAAYLKG
jgi:site-specific recombinase XerD